MTWARHAKTSIILIRSHTKLNSLGIEYGRLGSIVFLTFPDLPEFRAAKLRELARKIRELVRLLGNAALPAHFCPFVAGSELLSCTFAETQRYFKITGSRHEFLFESSGHRHCGHIRMDCFQLWSRHVRGPRAVR